MRKQLFSMLALAMFTAGNESEGAGGSAPALATQLRNDPAVQAAAEAINHSGAPLDVNELIDEAIDKATHALGANAGVTSVAKYVVHYLADKLAAYEEEHQPHTKVGQWLKKIIGLFFHHNAQPTV